MLSKRFSSYILLVLFVVPVLVVSGCSFCSAQWCGGGVESTPNVPGMVTATANLDSITISWSHPGQNILTGFTIFRDGETWAGLSTSAFIEIGTAGVNERSFEDSAVVPGTTYRYAVTADGTRGSSRQALSNLIEIEADN